jgi:hypothetical protein
LVQVCDGDPSSPLSAPDDSPLPDEEPLADEPPEDDELPEDDAGRDALEESTDVEDDDAPAAPPSPHPAAPKTRQPKKAAGSSCRII